MFAFAGASGGQLPPGVTDLAQIKEFEEKVGSKVDSIIRFLGLEGCADTIVGNDLLRGVSGGQRKRVTVGEMIAGSFLTTFADEISTGLDSATTYDIIHTMKCAVETMLTTSVVALLQPTPETFDLFHEVLLLDKGGIVYHGPREEIRPYFESLGFVCPPRKDLADFLQEVRWCGAPPRQAPAPA